MKKRLLLSLLLIIWVLADVPDLQFRGISQYIRLAIILFALVLLRMHVLINLPVFFAVSFICVLSFALNYPGGNYTFSYRVWVFFVSTLLFFNLFSLFRNTDIVNLLSWCSFALFGQIIGGVILGVTVYDSSDGGFGGSKGFMVSTNQLSYLILILLSSSLIMLQINSGSLGRQKLWGFHYLGIYLLILSAFLVSTKAVMVGVLVILGSYVYSLNRRLAVASLVLFSVSLLYGNSGIVLLIGENFSSINRITFGLAGSDSVLNIVTSGRWERILHHSDEIFNTGFFIPSRHVFVNFESDLFDSIYNFGYLGLLVIVAVAWKALNFVNSGNTIFIFTTVIIVFAAIFSGHFLSAILVSPFLALLGYLVSKNRDILQFSRR